MSKRKPEQSFCYAPKEESGCIFSKRFSGGFLLRHGRRRKKEGINHFFGCICRFTLGFCKNKKERTETLYQSFSPIMWNDSRNDTIPGYRFAIHLSFCIGCIWVQPGAKPDSTHTVHLIILIHKANNPLDSIVVEIHFLHVRKHLVISTERIGHYHTLRVSAI